MILVTGDTHGDLSRFKKKELHRLKKNDALIICGDFGFVWDGSKKEKKILKKLGKRKHKITLSVSVNLRRRFSILEIDVQTVSF